MRTTITTPKPAAKKAASTPKRGGGGRPKSMKSNSAPVNSARERGLKVVHISNPMRVEVSPAEFRSLVQELTGRHALEWPDHPRWRSTATTTANTSSLSGFALDNISNDRQVPAPAGGGTATLEVEVENENEEEEEEEEEVHPDFDLFGLGQPVISCSFGSDPSYDHYDHQMLYMGNDFVSSLMYEG